MDLAKLIDLRRTLTQYLDINGFESNIPKIKNDDDVVKLIEKHPMKAILANKGFIINNLTVLSNVYRTIDENNSDIFVLFATDEDVDLGKSLVEKVAQLILELNLTKVLLITSYKLSEAANTELGKIDTIVHYIESEFFNPTLHAFSPTIIKVYKNKEAKKFIEKNGKALNRILSRDPLCKFNGYKVGDIIEYETDIGYATATANTEKYYRIVVN